ncbi:ABSCISIC ACID-INSENSITIVE 5-like protein [Drosera capensis]
MMGSQGIGASSSAGKQLLPQPLVRQNSVYSLTFDEVQNQLGDLGKPLSSMNLNKLLNSICTAKANQSLGVDMENIGLSDQFPLQPHRSLSLTGALGKKTVDEVWRDIQRGQRSNIETIMKEKQPTLGDMTLEDFLVKAGVAMDESLPGNDNPVIESVATPQFPQPGQWMSFPQANLQHPGQIMMPYMQGQTMPHPIPMSAISMMDVLYGDNQVALQSPMMRALSDTQSSGRKKFGQQQPVDKSAERRQKRMIKNRESAARSRARKQAYTNDLENKVSRLEEENERLTTRKVSDNNSELFMFSVIVLLSVEASNHDTAIHSSVSFVTFAFIFSWKPMHSVKTYNPLTPPSHEFSKFSVLEHSLKCAGVGEYVVQCAASRTEISASKDKFSSLLIP